MKMPIVSSTSGGGSSRETVVWDLPTRVFHWLVVAIVAAAWITGEAVEEGTAGARWHFLGGYLLIGALAFRIGWGFIGGAYARFAEFVRSPMAVGAYARRLARGAPPRSVGHNPLGGWMVILLLAVLVLLAVSGLYAGEEGEAAGPLAHSAPWFDGEAWADLHEGAFNVLLWLVGLHVLGVLVDRMLTGDRLVKAMITGRKLVDESTPLLAKARVGTRRTLMMLAVAVAISLALANLPGSAPSSTASAAPADTRADDD